MQRDGTLCSFLPHLWVVCFGGDTINITFLRLCLVIIISNLIAGWVALWAPMFAMFSPMMGWGYLYGMLQLMQKMLIIWLLGSTVKKAPQFRVSSDFCMQHELVLCSPL